MKRRIVVLSLCIGLLLLLPTVFADKSPDINQDGKVDMKDVAIAALAFGSYPGHSRWNPDANVREDGRLIIDMKDIGKVVLARTPH